MAHDALCASCNSPLIIALENSDNDDVNESTSSPNRDAKDVPDDVLLGCGCHFHWSECLCDAFAESSSDRDCPSCSKSVITQVSGTQQLLCRLHNEGGVEEGLDILTVLREEIYNVQHPEERKARAFLEFCRLGDLPAILELLQDKEEEEACSPSSPDGILRYQDPVGKKQSGLHAAIEGKSREVVWLLLLLASELDLQRFPAVVFQEGAALGVMRGEIDGKIDIRSFRDAEGRTAEDLATQVGPPWHDWIGKGLLSP